MVSIPLAGTAGPWSTSLSLCHIRLPVATVRVPSPTANPCVIRAPGACSLALQSHIAQVQPFSQPSLASSASTLEFAILLQPGARHHVPSSLLGPGCRLFFPCCLQHKKEYFFPNLLPIKEKKTGKQNKNSSQFGASFWFFCSGEKDWHTAIVFFS